MKKIIIVIMILFLLCGCEKKVNDLKQVSDIAVLILQDETYDTAYLDNTQVSLIEKFIKDINNPEVNVDQFIIYDDNYKTTEDNSYGIYVRNNSCYILYDDIEFFLPSNDVGGYIARLVCNGYVAYVDQDSIKNMNGYYKNNDYGYNYIGYYKDDKYHFVYRSFYDGSGLIVTIGDKIETQFTNVDSLELDVISNNSLSDYIFPIIVILILISLIIVFKKIKFF